MGMMINRRRAYGGKSLPYDYEVEWIYMPFESYINTEIGGLHLNNFDITCIVKADGYPEAYATFFGIYGNEILDAHTGGVIVRQLSERTLQFYYGNYQSSGDTTRSTSMPSDFMTLRITQTASYCNGVIVGNTYSAYNTVMPINNPNLTMYLNCRKDYRNNSYGLSNNAVMKAAGWYKRFVYINNGVTVGDFIPVVKDNIGYMYDKVSGQLFGNAGSGSFVVGPRVNN